MRLLLDTHALLWFVTGNEKLSALARNALEDEKNERFVSHASAWEIAVKMRLGKLQLSIEYSELFPSTIDANGFNVLAPEFTHYLELLKLPQHHRDPFDRLLISQAIVENLTLMTCDPDMLAYGIPTYW